MSQYDKPDSEYTRTWSGGRGQVRFFIRSDGSRLRYFVAGSGGPPLVLLHTVRNQLDYFQRVIPLLWDHYTVYALDLPGMGWSDIVAGAGYEEHDLRSAVVEFVDNLQLRDVTLAGESVGAALALNASIDLGSRVKRVVAFNTYDYPHGLERANWLARFVIPALRSPILGPALACFEPRPIARAVLQGGYADKTKLPEDYLREILRSGRRPGYPQVARAAYRSLTRYNYARVRYPLVSVPVTLIYSELDWSHATERNEVARALANFQRFVLLEVGHFSAMEHPREVAEILIQAGGLP